MSIDTHESTPGPTNLARRLRRLLTAAPAVLGLIALAACGNSGTSTAAANPATSAPTASVGTGTGATEPPQFPGVSGLVAAISGKTLQVQGNSTQTAVTYNGTTTFTDTVTGSAADIKVGSCVTVVEPRSTASPSPSTSPPATKVTAGRVSITAAVKGSCVRTELGGGLGNGPRPSDAPIPTPPAGGAPGAGPGGGFRGFGGMNGKVTSVTSSGFVVESTGFGQSATTTSVTVTTSSSTTFSKTVSSTSKAVATGKCVTALGKTDTTGALTATSISVRTADNGTCIGFGARGGFNG